MNFDEFTLGRSRVTIGLGTWTAAAAEQAEQGRRVFLFSQQPVWRHFGAAVSRELKVADEDVFLLPDGESIKDLETYAQVQEWLAKRGADRASRLAVLGGGVVGDLVGFVAAGFMRGIGWLYLPSTLLAQQDAAVGGKVAVNLPQGKNLVGHFWSPERVIIDLSFLRTLPQRQLNSGYMEFLKHGVLKGPDLLDKAIRLAWPPRSWSGIGHLLAEGVRVKAEIVQSDPYENGRRRLLNLGHTLAHALESNSAYQLLHGEAVGYGLIFAVCLARELGSQWDWDPLITHISKHLPPLNQIPSDDAILGAVAMDKKRERGRVAWIIPWAPGKVTVEESVGSDQVARSLLRWRDMVTHWRETVTDS